MIFHLRAKKKLKEKSGPIFFGCQWTAKKTLMTIQFLCNPAAANEELKPYSRSLN